MQKLLNYCSSCKASFPVGTQVTVFLNNLAVKTECSRCSKKFKKTKT